MFSTSFVRPILQLRHPTINARLFSSNKKSLAGLVKELRASTGAPMVECKRALEAAGGDDLEAAITWLREQGSARATAKIAGREASEGLVGLVTNAERTSAALVALGSETDFAGRSPEVAQLMEDLASAALISVEDGAFVDVSKDSEFWKLPLVEQSGKTTANALEEAVLSIRENLELREVHRMGSVSGDSVVGGYVHGKSPHSVHAGSAVAAVELTGSSKDTDVICKELAMHIVAAKPTYLSPKDVPANIIEAEKAILATQIADTGKPPEIVEKIVSGRLNKFYESVCLTEQNHYVVESNPKISKYLKEKGLEIKRFMRLAVKD